MCCAPTNDREEEDKDQFNSKLNLESKPDRDLTILKSDFNAKIGNGSILYEQVMETHGPREMHEN